MLSEVAAAVIRKLKVGSQKLKVKVEKSKSQKEEAEGGLLIERPAFFVDVHF